MIPLTVKIFLGPGKVSKYFGEGYLHPPKRKHSWKNSFSLIFFYYIVKWRVPISPPPPFPQVPLEPSSGVATSIM